MKIRTGFVSNSSSSSFTCDVCGRSETGFDCSPHELGMVNCINNHTMCEEEMLEEWERDLENDEYECPERCCPLCKFVVFGESDLAQYLLKEHGVPRDEVFAKVKMENKRRKKLYDTEYNMYVCTKFGLDRQALLEKIKNTFATYKDFHKHIRGY